MKATFLFLISCVAAVATGGGIFQHELVGKTKLTKNVSQNISFDEYHYFIKITIGTPIQRFFVHLDTSTTAFWVPTYHDLVPHPIFNPKKSKTYKRIPNSDWIIDYGDPFGITGFLGKDTMQLIDDDTAILRIPNTIFGLANCVHELECDANGQFDAPCAAGFCGVLGIGLDTDGGQFPPTILHHAYKHGLIEKPMFSIYLDKKPDIKSGAITYGGLDSKHCSSSVNYYNLTSTTQYKLQMNSVSFGSQTFFGDWDTIFQPGAGIRGPSGIINALYQAVNATKDPFSFLMFVDCNAKLDPVKITFGNEEYLIEEEQMKVPWPYQPYGCTFPFYISDQGFWILGDPWHRSYCNVYNFDEKRIGFSNVIV